MKMHIAYINTLTFSLLVQHHFHSFVPNQPLLEHHCIYTLLQGFQESDELIVPMVSYVITVSPPTFRLKWLKSCLMPLLLWFLQGVECPHLKSAKVSPATSSMVKKAIQQGPPPLVTRFHNKIGCCYTTTKVAYGWIFYSKGPKTTGPPPPSSTRNTREGLRLGAHGIGYQCWWKVSPATAMDREKFGEMSAVKIEWLFWRKTGNPLILCLQHTTTHLSI